MTNDRRDGNGDRQPPSRPRPTVSDAATAVVEIDAPGERGHCRANCDVDPIGDRVDGRRPTRSFRPMALRRGRSRLASPTRGTVQHRARGV